MGLLRPTLTGFALALLIAACSAPDPPEGEFAAVDTSSGDTGSDVATDGGDTTDTGGAEVVPTMDGYWMHYDQVVSCVDFIGQFEQLTNYLHIVHVTQDDQGNLTEEWRACNTQLSEVFGLQPAVPASFYETGHFPFITNTGTISSTEVGGEYVSGEVAVLWGWDTDDRVNDAFPEEIDDPRISDLDEDGDPGLSLIFNQGDCIAYLAQRAVNEYEGAFVAPDRIEGGVEGYNQQIVLGGTGSLCQVSYDLTFPPARNQFVRVRIDGQGGARDFDLDGNGEVSCDELTSEIEIRPLELNHSGDTLVNITPFNHNCCRPQPQPDFPECPVDQ